MLCLGLDPDGMTDAAAAERQCLQLLEATLDTVCAVKPNLAFFEQFGSAGYAVLERLRAAVPGDRILILDGKRGDMANTSAAYARALFDVLGADAITVNALQGGDAVAPFLDRPGRGVFILARTSNPGAADFLEAPVRPGRARAVRAHRHRGAGLGRRRRRGRLRGRRHRAARRGPGAPAGAARPAPAPRRRARRAGRSRRPSPPRSTPTGPAPSWR